MADRPSVRRNYTLTEQQQLWVNDAISRIPASLHDQFNAVLDAALWINSVKGAVSDAIVQIAISRAEQTVS